MERILAEELSPKLHGKKVLVKGWIAESRDFGALKFLILRDSSGFLQVTAVKKKVKKELLEKIESLTKESVVEVIGKVQKSEKAMNKAEVIPEKLSILSLSEAPVPLDISGKIQSDQSSRLDYRCIDLRTPQNQAIFKIQSKLIEGAVEWLNKNKYQQVFTPCLMGTASESGAEVFEVNYYNKKAFLRQDPQLHRQLTIAGGIEKLYDIGPSWRAEKSHTTRHICEHRTIAVEKAFLEDELETERIQEKIVVSALKKVKEDCKKELQLLGVKVSVPKTPFPELRFPEIYSILEKKGKKLEKVEALDTEAEDILWKYIQEKHKAEFYFINRFPFAEKPFYVMRVDEEPEYARSIDLYYRGVELSSGGQREHRHEKIIEQVKEKGLSLEGVEWFTKFFRYGVPPHGGFAIGIERLTKQLLNLENIRDTALFPRDPERLNP